MVYNKLNKLPNQQRYQSILSVAHVCDLGVFVSALMLAIANLGVLNLFSALMLAIANLGVFVFSAHACDCAVGLGWRRRQSTTVHQHGSGRHRRDVSRAVAVGRYLCDVGAVQRVVDGRFVGAWWQQ